MPESSEDTHYTHEDDQQHKYYGKDASYAERLFVPPADKKGKEGGVQKRFGYAEQVVLHGQDGIDIAFERTGRRSYGGKERQAHYQQPKFKSSPFRPEKDFPKRIKNQGNDQAAEVLEAGACRHPGGIHRPH